MSPPLFDFAKANDVLKHFYGGGHREYPYCPECVTDNMRHLKARLVRKYRSAA